MGATGYTSDPAAVDSVNGQTGDITLDAADVSAEPAGAVSGHVLTVDPHGDRSYADGLAGALLPRPGSGAETVTTWSAGDEWLRINAPASPGDTNPDLLRCFSGATRVFWLNGNSEPRSSASTVGRVGYRGYEYTDGSSDVFWEISTNPTDPALRESLVSVYGTLHGTYPGWMFVRDTLSAGNLQTAGTLTVAGVVVPVVQTFETATLGTSIVKRAGTADPGTTIDRGRVFWRGTLQWSTGLTVGASYQLARVAAAHRPASEKSFPIRSVGSGSNISTSLHLGTDGWLTPEVSLGTSTGTVHLPLDGISWDLS